MNPTPLAVATNLVTALLLSIAVYTEPDQTPASAVGLTPPVKTPAAESILETSVPGDPAQTPAPSLTAQAPATKSQAELPRLFRAEQLDQLLAPIALFPDALLAQILMAATYPIEVVKADRWVQDASHANLHGDQLASAIEAEPWDPSVKSLLPFPQILRMMDEQLDWTEQLDNAVLAQHSDVTDAIQRLRYRGGGRG